MNIPEENIRYIDLHELSETFADSFGTLTFDGQSARIELRITRLDIPDPHHQQKKFKTTARQYPSCRLALTPDAFFKLYDQMHQMITAMKAQGDIKPIQPESGTIH